MNLLTLFIVLQLCRYGVEQLLARKNRDFYMDATRQQSACETLGIDAADFRKTLTYTLDKEKFSHLSSMVNLVCFLAFLSLGGFGWVEAQAKAIAAGAGYGQIVTGVLFFGIAGFLSALLSMPFSYYFTFGIEEKHGFNRQRKKGFFLDALKNLVLTCLLGGLLLCALLWIMEATGSWWWLLAWLAMTAFQTVMVLIYPTLLAPLFNKFSPLEEGELKDAIFRLAKKVNFQASGIFVMNASIRSTHGNAFFTGIFSEKRIVLFDTLVEAMNVKELVAVLAHELGHFKLNHVRWALIRGTLIMGATFYLLSLCLPLADFYLAFHLDGISNYGALLVFFLWFSLLNFFITPVLSFLSRKNEFAADAFAREQVGNPDDLSSALKKLRQKNHAMPLTHPLFSAVYHSHPPLIERINALHS